MIYVGLIEDEGKERMYVSSVSEGELETHFFNNAVFIDFTPLTQRTKDPVSQRVELNKLRNVLVAGGAQVIIETV